MLTVGSLFSGVGGFDLALERAGLTVRWQVEIDPAARSVLRRHWPGTTLHEDVRDVGKHNLDAVDLVCGGFPCQDVSVAGRRAGLAGGRSGLWWEFHRIVAELHPRWVLIENVPGLLSSNGGRDMGAVLGGLGQLGYGYAYAVLDAAFFGVPQRRRRVFIVGHSGDWGAPAQVLLEPESLCGDTPPRRTPGEDVAGGLRASAACRGYNDNGDAGVILIPEIAGRLRARAGGGSTTELDGHGAYVAGTVSAKWSKGTGGPSGDEVQNLVAGSFEQNSMSGRGTLGWQAGDGVVRPVKPQADHQMIVAHTLTAESASGYDASEDGTGRTNLVVFGISSDAIDRSGEGVQGTAEVRAGLGIIEEASPAVRARHPNAVAFTNRGYDSGPSAETLRAGSHGALPMVASTAVRRLTPVEVTRLQGFPDDWLDGLNLSDSTRYRLCGNAVAVPVAEWIARRIVAMEAG